MAQNSSNVTNAPEDRPASESIPQTHISGATDVTASPDLPPRSPLDEAVVAEFSGVLGCIPASIDQQLLDCHRFYDNSGAPTPAMCATASPCPPTCMPPLDQCPPSASTALPPPTATEANKKKTACATTSAATESRTTDVADSKDQAA